MRTVGFVSPKGGAGKTTAALLLALGLAEQGRRVAIIDSDPNKPLVHWGSLAGRPPLITVHPAPTVQDVRDALREAHRCNPEWIILDTEGSLRGAMAFTTMRLDLILTPLAGSQLEALQAIRSAEIVEEFGGRSGLRPRHRCLLTRVPAALKPQGLRAVVAQLHERRIELLPTALLEKEAFRTLFAVGGGFPEVERSGVSGVAAARRNAEAYLEAVLEAIE